MRSSLSSLNALAFALVMGGFVAEPAAAQDKAVSAQVVTLDALAAKAVTSDRVWQVKKPRGPGHDYWAWKSDGSVCVRLGENAGKCADTGRWTLQAEKVCYELSWWGEAQGLKSTCFRISDKGKGRYAWVTDNALAFHEFSVVKQ
jgi:hypothetical protein